MTVSSALEEKQRKEGGKNKKRDRAQGLSPMRAPVFRCAQTAGAGSERHRETDRERESEGESARARERRGGSCYY